MIRDRQPEDLKRDRMRQLALVRLVEIVGEAATRLSPEGRARYPSIPWREASNMRNRLIHGYDTVDLDVLWDTIVDDLPPLIAELEKLLKAGPRGENH
ncbi:MAG TPA: HepT-like ribonuclease domain-containing protein [Phycisphaerae bacterium]|nr:HepT-like ribonuclease domain-containing protein [Phycisphaerae bacterium]